MRKGRERVTLLIFAPFSVDDRAVPDGITIARVQAYGLGVAVNGLLGIALVAVDEKGSSTNKAEKATLCVRPPASRGENGDS